MKVEIKVKLKDYIQGIEVEGVYSCFVQEEDSTTGFPQTREEETLTVEGVEYFEGGEKDFEDRFEAGLMEVFSDAFEAAKNGKDYI